MCDEDDLDGEYSGMSIIEDTEFLYSPHDLQEDVEFLLSCADPSEKPEVESLLNDVLAFVAKDRDEWNDEEFNVLVGRYFDLSGVDGGLL